MQISTCRPSLVARATDPTRSSSSDLRAAPLARQDKMADCNHVVFPRKLLKKFILLYKEQDCLWDRRSLLYKNRKKRHEAITRLTELVQEYEPTATRVHILRKIESLRACMRREHKKVLDSRSKVGSVDVYTPHLWYYDMLSFVVGEECEAEPSEESEDEPVPTCVSIFQPQAKNPLRVFDLTECFFMFVTS